MGTYRALPSTSHRPGYYNGAVNSWYRGMGTYRALPSTSHRPGYFNGVGYVCGCVPELESNHQSVFLFCYRCPVRIQWNDLRLRTDVKRKDAYDGGKAIDRVRGQWLRLVRGQRSVVNGHGWSWVGRRMPEVGDPWSRLVLKLIQV